MKMKRILALLLAAVLCFSVHTAFGSDIDGTSSAASAEESSGITFPLPEKKTLTAWRMGATSDPKLGIVDYNDIPVWQELEEKTNVHIEWQIPPSGQEQENFNLMISSGEYPDLIWSVGTYYMGGLDKAIADDFIIPLNDYMDGALSDYNKLISADESVYKDCKTDEGNFPCVYMINTPDQGPWYGMTIRKDWLDELKLEIPVTYDDWHDVLVAFKEQKGAKSPIWLNYHAGDVFSVFSAGYGVSVLGGQGDGFINVDGKIKFSPMEEGYREYITMLHDWYAEGLINPDFYSDTTNFFRCPDTLWATGNAGAWPEVYTLIDLLPLMSATPEMDVVPIPAPVKNEGDQLHLRQCNPTCTGVGVGISTQCKDPELAAAYLNLGSKEDWARLIYYGVEGDTYNMVDGKPVFTDKILANADGLTTADAMTKYCSNFPGYYMWDRELQGAGSKAISAINEVWGSNADVTYVVPNITMTSEEASEYARIMGDITTYAEEMTTKFILGREPLDNWDNYVQTLKRMGADDAIALKQAALDRFLNR